MSFTLLVVSIGAFALIMSYFGIEAALTAATLVSGLIWLGYKLQQRLRGKSTAKAQEPDLVEYARSFFPIFLVVLLIRSFLYEPFRIPSGSMMPTLLVGDFILVEKFAYGLRVPVLRHKFLETGEPQRGDVVVFRFPENDRIDYIKRLIGLPGDRIAYANKTLYINGEPQPVQLDGVYEPVGSGMRARGSLQGVERLGKTEHSVLINPHAPDFPGRCTFMNGKEVTVPDGHFVMIGDNRDDSNDSRCWGLVPERNLVGRAKVIWLNFDPNLSGFFDWSRFGDSIH
jgi:signal peptidase I